MTNAKSTKRALLTSVMALILCFTMLLGTTFAWFTDSVTSSGNIIKSGTLEAGMYWADGGKAVPGVAIPVVDTNWNNAASGPMFTYENWEPGYVEAKHILITNEGSLAFNYELRIITNEILSELADVIDVYYFESAQALDRTTAEGGTYLGTLTDVMGTNDNIADDVKGSLGANESRTLSLAFKMQESAGNEYQGLTLGEFAVQLIATQQAKETDSFDDQYDAAAPSPELPAALVTLISPKKTIYSTKSPSTVIVGEDLEIQASGKLGWGTPIDKINLDTAYQFLPTESYDEALKSDYANWHADYVLKADSLVPANSMAIAGYYDEWCALNDYEWVALQSSEDIAANTEIRLVQGLGGGNTFVDYTAICQLGNDGIGFLCGAVDITGVNKGTTLTVELRVYETYPKGHEPHELPDGTMCNNLGSANCETGYYEVIGVTEYTFGGAYNTYADGSVAFEEPTGENTLVSVVDVVGSDYTVPADITALGSGVFAQNSNITTVTVPASVTDFGATGVSATGASSGAFKGSAVTSVIIEDGATEIPAAAFNGAKKLTSVTIPDSVTTIGVNAFRQTAITELVIPETITNINNGAFRDMSALTTVTIEGNVSFTNYAFRSCPNLTSIYLLGDDVTFNGGQFACHSDNGDATGITIYVKNATVAARVYAAQTSAYGYEVKILGAAADGSDANAISKVSNTTQLKDAIDNGQSAVVLGEGNYTLPNTDGKTVEIVGTKDTVIDVTGGYYADTANLTFKGVTFDCILDSGNGGDYELIYSKDATFIDCTFNGAHGVGRDGAKYIGCTFNLPLDYVWSFAHDVVFDGCTFNSQGKALLLYNHGGSEMVNVTVTNCIFNSTAPAYAGAISNQPCAAIEIDNFGCSFNLTTSGNTIDSKFSGEWRIKSFYGNGNTVTVNGTSYSQTALDGTLLNVVGGQVQ